MALTPIGGFFGSTASAGRAYILVDFGSNIFTASSLSGIWTKSSLTSIQTHGYAYCPNIPYDTANNQWLVPDLLGNVYKINLAATASNGTISAPADCSQCAGIDYKNSNGTLIICGTDTGSYASIWYSTNYGSYTKVRLTNSVPRAANIRFDINANQWNVAVGDNQGTGSGNIYYSQNDGISFTSAGATLTFGNVANNPQVLSIGASDVILTQDAVATNGTYGYSTNGTSYSHGVATDAGLDSIAGKIKGLAYQSSSGLYLLAGNAVSGGTKGIATSTTPSTVASFTFYNNPSGAQDVQGATCDPAGNLMLFGSNPAGTAPSLVTSSNFSTFTDNSSAVSSATTMIQMMGSK